MWRYKVEGLVMSWLHFTLGLICGLVLSYMFTGFMLGIARQEGLIFTREDIKEMVIKIAKEIKKDDE